MSLSGVALVWSAAVVISIFRKMERAKREQQGLGAPVRRGPLLQGPEVAERAATFGLKLTRYDEHVSVRNEGRGTLEAELGPGAALCLQVGGSLEVVTEVLISGLPGELRLRSSRGPREHPIGDPSFDSLFAFDGTLWSTRGALTPSARSALRELLLLGGEGASLSLSQGQLRLKPGSSGARALAQSHLPALLQQARLLVAELRPQPGEGWLRDAARHDPVAGVRANALRELLEAPLIPDVRELLASARQDPADEVRLLAGLALADRAVLDEVSDGVLWDEVARREAYVLERLEGAGATRALERLLLRPERSAAERAAAALGRVGGADSVQDLRALIERVSRASTREAAQHAIAAIQRRLPGAEPGQISMTAAEAETGALSVAVEGGELSHAPEARGLLMKSTHQ